MYIFIIIILYLYKNTRKCIIIQRRRRRRPRGVCPRETDGHYSRGPQYRIRETRVQININNNKKNEIKISLHFVCIHFFSIFTTVIRIYNNNTCMAVWILFYTAIVVLSSALILYYYIPFGCPRWAWAGAHKCVSIIWPGVRVIIILYIIFLFYV